MWFHFPEQNKEHTNLKFCPPLCVWEPMKQKTLKTLTMANKNCDWRWSTQIKVEMGELKVNNLIAEEYWLKKFLCPLYRSGSRQGRNEWRCIWKDEMRLDWTGEIILNILVDPDYLVNFIKTTAIKKPGVEAGSEFLPYKGNKGYSFRFSCVLFKHTTSTFFIWFFVTYLCPTRFVCWERFFIQANILSFIYIFEYKIVNSVKIIEWNDSYTSRIRFPWLYMVFLILIAALKYVDLC